MSSKAYLAARWFAKLRMNAQNKVEHTEVENKVAAVEAAVENAGGAMSTSAVRTNHDTNVSFTTGDTGKALIMLSSTTRANYAKMNYNYNLRLYVNNVEVASQNLASVLELSSRYSGTGLTVYYLYSGSPNTSFNVKGNWSYTGGSEGYVQIATVSY